MGTVLHPMLEDMGNLSRIKQKVVFSLEISESH